MVSSILPQLSGRKSYWYRILHPTGNFMYVCNQRGDAVTTFRVDGDGRRLHFTGQYTPIGSPASIVFLTT